MTGTTRTRIAPHTAAGLLLLSLGLAQFRYRRSFNKTDDVSNDSRRILADHFRGDPGDHDYLRGRCASPSCVRHSHDLQRTALNRGVAQPGRA